MEAVYVLGVLAWLSRILVFYHEQQPVIKFTNILQPNFKRGS